MTDFYIFRHGETRETDGGGIFAGFFRLGGGQPSLPILTKGIPTLEKIGKFLKDIPIDASFTSPYLRCVESSKVVGSISGKRFIEDERIRELEGGIKKFGRFRERVFDFLSEIHKKNYSAISICTHGAVIAAIKHYETTGRFFFPQLLDFPNPGNLIIIKDSKVKKINFNK